MKSWSSWRFCVVCCLLCLLTPRDVTAELFSSVASLTSLVTRGPALVDVVNQYIQREENRLQYIRSALSSLPHVGKQNKPADIFNSEATQFVEHPINSVNLIQRWLHIQHLCNQTTPTPFNDLRTLVKDNIRIEVPTPEDYYGAVAAVARLQKTYQLPTSSLAAGKIHNSSADAGLHKTDYFYIAERLMEKDHSLALQWYKMFLQEKPDDKDMEKSAHSRMINIYERADDIHRAHESALKASQLDKNSYDEQEWKIKIMETGTRKKAEKVTWKPEWEKTNMDYESLCRGENITNDITLTKDLICVYRKGLLPYVQYKEEIHSFRPIISLILDVITDKQANMLKQKAFPSLSRALVGEPATSTISDVRVGQLSWLWDTDPEVRRISEKVADITGLSTKYSNILSDAEAFQVVNYGMGGQYEQHYDFYEDSSTPKSLPKLLEGTGDRISTFMFYLNEVEAGGATVFPRVGVRVPPVKHAAAYWYNFDLAGKYERLSRHAGCPVLLGQKWVANKWIRQFGQMFKRPCGLTEEQDPIWYS